MTDWTDKGVPGGWLLALTSVPAGVCVNLVSCFKSLCLSFASAKCDGDDSYHVLHLSLRSIRDVVLGLQDE